MDLTGEYPIAEGRDVVWAALNDPDVLRTCIPGCETVEKLSDTAFTAQVRVKVGPVSARFTGRVDLTDLDPPGGCTITGEGQGGAAGFGRGAARVTLVETAPGQTLLTYTADAQVGGKLAQLGSRLVDATARKMADDFFAAFQQRIGAGAAPPDLDTAVVAEPEAVPTPPESIPDTIMPAPSSLPSPVPAVPGAVMPETAAAVEPATPATGQAGKAEGVGPMVWIPLLVLVLALALWAVL
ncbi:MAG: hypothetical protein RLY86_1840 [Pseudomonadota bacterium]|jgi:carbon monoxide dehydrogenase subunit G